MLRPDSHPHLQAISAAAPSAAPGAIGDAASSQMRAGRGLPPRALQRVREHVLAHFRDAISVEAMAAVVGLSRSHFFRAFKQSEGVTPHRFLLECRVKRAQQLLAATELPLSEIALEAGFSDQSHCTRRFRELVGVTPGSYRRLMR